jgi:hypothetical protein
VPDDPVAGLAAAAGDENAWSGHGKTICGDLAAEESDKPFSPRAGMWEARRSAESSRAFPGRLTSVSIAMRSA